MNGKQNGLSGKQMTEEMNGFMQQRLFGSKVIKKMEKQKLTKEELIRKTWNKKYPCPCCEKGKLCFTKTDTCLFISCETDFGKSNGCNTTWIREYSPDEYDGKFDEDGSIREFNKKNGHSSFGNDTKPAEKTCIRCRQVLDPDNLRGIYAPNNVKEESK